MSKYVPITRQSAKRRHTNRWNIVAYQKRMGGGAYLLVNWPSHLTIDHASLSRRSAAPTTIRQSPTVGRSICCFHKYIPGTWYILLVNHILFMFLNLWPPLISKDSDCFLATIYVGYQTSPCHIRLFSSSALNPFRTAVPFWGQTT